MEGKPETKKGNPKTTNPQGNRTMEAANMNKTPWIPENDFKELESSVWDDIKSRVVCVKDSNYCTSCGRCQEEEAE